MQHKALVEEEKELENALIPAKVCSSYRCDQSFLVDSIADSHFTNSAVSRTHYALGRQRTPSRT